MSKSDASKTLKKSYTWYRRKVVESHGRMQISRNRLI